MKLSAIMSLNGAGFTGPLAGIRSSLGSTVAALAGLAGASLSVAGAVAGVKKALDFGGQLTDLSAVTGASVGDLVVLRQALDDTGVGADSTRMVLTQMQRALGGINEEGQPTNKTFAQLGLNLEELKGLGATEQLDIIGKAIGNLKDPAQQTSAAMQIFGRSGAMMKSFFADPAAIETARKSLGGLPAIMQRNAALFDSISDSLGRVKAKGMGLFAGIAEGVAPALSAVTGALDGMDFSGVGQKIGNAIAVGIEVIRSGKIGEVLALGLGIAARTGLNALANIPMALGTALLATLGAKSLWVGIAQVAIAGMMGIGSALLKLFTAPLTALQAGMDWVVDKLFAALSKIPGVSKLLGIENYGPGKSFSEHLKVRERSGWTAELGQRAQAAAEIAAEMADSGIAQVKQGFVQVGDIMRNYEPVKPFGDIEAEKARLAGVLGELNAQVAARREATQGQAAAAAGGAGGALGELAAAGGGRGGRGGGIESDRLARIGGMVGGGLAGIEHGRRTASNTERAAKATERLVELFASSSGRGAQAAVWA